MSTAIARPAPSAAPASGGQPGVGAAADDDEDEVDDLPERRHPPPAAAEPTYLRLGGTAHLDPGLDPVDDEAAALR